ncbi:MAG: histidinol-phosphatase [Treponema sp.]|nr:histidinol-phosphatase [Treponema sp.]
MPYLYETHLHTSQGSLCASSLGRDYIQGFKDAGYRGIFVTDHFYRGNCAVDRNLPWREWVKEFCRGYEDAREEGARRGLDVFFGWEETFDGDDYLVYGLDREWLLEHPEVRNWTRKGQFAAVRAAGGCVVHAHPFRQHFYLSRVILSPALVDAVEAANAGNHEGSYDALAMSYARKLGLPATAGSDIHDTDQLEEGEMYGVYLEKPLESAGDYAAAVRNGSIQGIHVPEDRCRSRGDEKIILPLEILDANERNRGKDLQAFLEKPGRV